MQELIALRKFRKPTQGIDLVRLNEGDKSKRKKRAKDPEGVFGLQPGVKPDDDEFVSLLGEDFVADALGLSKMQPLPLSPNVL